LREFANGVDQRAGDEGDVGEADALLRLERVLGRRARRLDVLVVDLDDHQRVRGGLQGAHHVLGGAAPDVRERDRGVALAGSD
jgi:hypothetical protein